MRQTGWSKAGFFLLGLEQILWVQGAVRGRQGIRWNPATELCGSDLWRSSEVQSCFTKPICSQMSCFRETPSGPPARGWRPACAQAPPSTSLPDLQRQGLPRPSPVQTASPLQLGLDLFRALERPQQGMNSTHLFLPKQLSCDLLVPALAQETI